MLSPKKINVNNKVFKNIFQSKINKENEKMNNKIIEITNRPMLKVREDEIGRASCRLNQKLKPCFSCGNNCLTRDDYSVIEKSKDSPSPGVKLKKIKFKKLGVSKQ